MNDNFRNNYLLKKNFNKIDFQLKRYFLFIFFLCNCFCKAQFTYHFIYQSPYLSYPYNIPQTITSFDHGLVSVDGGGGQIEVLKFDSVGNNKWIKLFNPPVYTYPGGIVELANHDLIISGAIDINSIDETYFLLRIDEFGNLISMKISSDTTKVAYDWGGSISISKTLFNSYILSGGNIIDQFSSPSIMNFISKIDSNENILWTRTFKTDSDISAGHPATKVVENGNIISANISYQDSLTTYHLAITKFDSSGNILWSKSTIADFGMGRVWDIVEVGDSYYIFAGKWVGTFQYPNVIKVSKNNGDLIWHTQYQDFEIWYPSVLKTHDNRILFNAELDSTFAFSSACLELDSNGFVVNSQLFPSSIFPFHIGSIIENLYNQVVVYGLGVVNNPYLGHVILNIDSLNQFPCITSAINFDSPVFLQDSFISMGILLSDTFSLLDISSQVLTGSDILSPIDLCSFSNVQSLQSFFWQISPNPTSGKFSIGNEKLKIDRCCVYSMLGNLIFESVDGSSDIDITDQPAGLYFILIKSEDKFFSYKLIKE